MTLDDLALLFQARYATKHELAAAQTSVESATRCLAQAVEKRDRLASQVAATEERISRALK